jgi:acyl-coenzyme A thioesterase PaaI-like protein
MATKLTPFMRSLQTIKPLSSSSSSIAPLRHTKPTTVLHQLSRRSQSTITATSGSATSQVTSPPIPPPPPPPKRSRAISILVTLATIASLGYAVTVGIIAVDLWPQADDFAEQKERELQSNPLLAALRADPKFTESRPHLKIPAPLRQHSFTGGDLISSNKLAVPPIVFTTKDGSEMVGVFYLGRSLCGHPGIIHGGLLATLLDEGLARTCFNALPNKVGMTATLTVDYRAPVVAEQWVVLKGKTTKVDGRKAWVEGYMASLDKDGNYGKPLVEGRGLFVEPRNAKLAGALMRIVS